MLLLVCANDYLLNRIKVVLVRILMIYPIFHIKFTMVKKEKQTTTNTYSLISFLILHSTLYLEILKKRNVKNEFTALGPW